MQPLNAFSCLTRRQTIFSPSCKFFKSERFLEKFPRISPTGVFFGQRPPVPAGVTRRAACALLGRAEDIPPPCYPLPQQGTLSKVFKTHQKIPALEVTSNMWYFVAFLKLSYQKTLIPVYFSINIFATRLTKDYHQSITLVNLDRGTPPTMGSQWLGPCITVPPPSSPWVPAQQHTQDVLKIKPQTPESKIGISVVTLKLFKEQGIAPKFNSTLSPTHKGQIKPLFERRASFHEKLQSRIIQIYR